MRYSKAAKKIIFFLFLFLIYLEIKGTISEKYDQLCLISPESCKTIEHLREKRNLKEQKNRVLLKSEDLNKRSIKLSMDEDFKSTVLIKQI